MDKINEYHPNYSIHPGEYILEFIELEIPRKYVRAMIRQEEKRAGLSPCRMPPDGKKEVTKLAGNGIIGATRTNTPEKRSFVMNHYTTVAEKMKNGLLTFCEKLCAGLSRTSLKFVGCMLFGLLKGQSVMLSEIARALDEGIALKKTIERLSGNLKRFKGTDELTENYANAIKESIDKGTVFVLDPGEICKEYSRKQEKLCKVWDASKKRTVNGYKLLEITALTHKAKLPVPVYTRLYSTKEESGEEDTKESVEALKELDRQFGKTGIRVMDRGMDDIKVYEQCRGRDYIVRAKANRNVIYKGETVNIADLARRFRGKIGLKHTDKYGKRHNLKMWHVEVELPELGGQAITLIMVHGYDKREPEPCLLLTNMDAAGKRKSLRVLKVYLMRWRVEEYYRFKKVQFDLEDIRVMSLCSIRTLNLLASILSGWLALLASRSDDPVLLGRIFALAKRIHAVPQFSLYALADGIFEAFSKSFVSICDAFPKPVAPAQKSLTLHGQLPSRSFASACYISNS